MIRTVLPSLDFLVQVLLRDSTERESACQHHVEKDAECPHIDRLAIVFVLSDDFWAHVTRCSAEDLQALVASDYHTEAKVD